MKFVTKNGKLKYFSIDFMYQLIEIRTKMNKMYDIDELSFNYNLFIFNGFLKFELFSIFFCAVVPLTCAYFENKK